MCSQDGTLLLSTIQSQFPHASGLKYRNEETHSIRAVRMTSTGLLSAPDDFWGDRVYLVVTKGGGESKARLYISQTLFPPFCVCMCS